MATCMYTLLRCALRGVFAYWVHRAWAKQKQKVSLSIYIYICMCVYGHMHVHTPSFCFEGCVCLLDCHTHQSQMEERTELGQTQK